MNSHIGSRPLRYSTGTEEIKYGVCDWNPSVWSDFLEHPRELEESAAKHALVPHQGANLNAMRYEHVARNCDEVET